MGKMKNILFISSILFFLSGCGGNLHIEYEGSRLNAEQVSRLTGIDSAETKENVIQIRGINGKIIQPENILENTVEVLPGTYQIRLGYFNGVYQRYAEFNWIAEPGHNYFIKCNIDRLKSGELPPATMIDVWVENDNSEVVARIVDWGEITKIDRNNILIPTAIPGVYM